MFIISIFLSDILLDITLKNEVLVKIITGSKLLITFLTLSIGDLTSIGA